MSQCVPRWELDVDTPAPAPPPPPPAPTTTTPQQQLPPLVPTAGTSERYEVAELPWENGHLALQGHGVPRVAKPLPTFPSAAPWNKHHHHHGGGGGGGHGTLEAVVDQATRPQLLEVGPSVDLLAWLGGSHPSSAAAAADVLVPCGEAVAGGRKRGRGSAAASQGSAAPGCEGSTLATFDMSGGGSGGGAGGDEVCFTPTPATTTTTTTTTNTNTTTTNNNNNNNSASLGSPETENTSFGRGGGCRRPPQRDGVCDEEEKAAKRQAGRSSSSAKKRRVAAVHNQSERKRRDRINQRMNTLQKLVPNSSKMDKASMLDEVIEYVKQLQAQVQMMNWMSGMLMPMPLQMSVIANVAQMSQMGMGMGMMDLSSLGRAGPVGLPSPHPLLHPSLFLPIATPSWDGSGDRLQQPSGPVVPPDPFSAFLACQAAQPMSMDAYNRIAALYQHLYQQNTQSNSSKP